MIRQIDADGRAKMTGKEYQALLRLFAAISALKEVGPVLWDRLALVGGMARCNYKNAERKLDDICNQILGTVPTNKLIAMQRELKAVKVYLRIGPDAAPHGQDQVIYVDEGAFLRLLDQIVGMNCLLCEKTGKEVKRCEWLKLIEDVLPYGPDPELDPADGTCQIAGRSTIIDEEGSNG